ncbi:uncharacterized protein VTP21DRAFT_5554 [Calcarisporiella thermophila]|uniref:uncharacterized protein n=1 Tax=Calcarisporiella thermophila TaxID=911321 RepID=UPI00374280E7
MSYCYDSPQKGSVPISHLLSSPREAGSPPRHAYPGPTTPSSSHSMHSHEPRSLGLHPLPSSTMGENHLPPPPPPNFLNYGRRFSSPSTGNARFLRPFPSPPPPPSFLPTTSSASARGMHTPSADVGLRISPPSSSPLQPPPLSIEERRQRNKQASAKYRAKKHMQHVEMRQLIQTLTEQNKLLHHQLDEGRREIERLRLACDKLRARCMADKVLKKLNTSGEKPNEWEKKRKRGASSVESSPVSSPESPSPSGCASPVFLPS